MPLANRLLWVCVVVVLIASSTASFKKHCHNDDECPEGNHCVQYADKRECVAALPHGAVCDTKKRELCAGANKTHTVDCPTKGRCPGDCDLTIPCTNATLTCDLTDHKCVAVIPKGHRCFPFTNGSANTKCVGAKASEPARCHISGRCPQCFTDADCPKGRCVEFKNGFFCRVEKQVCLSHGMACVPGKDKCCGMKSSKNSTDCPSNTKQCPGCDSSHMPKGCKTCDLTQFLCADAVRPGRRCKLGAKAVCKNSGLPKPAAAKKFFLLELEQALAKPKKKKAAAPAPAPKAAAPPANAPVDCPVRGRCPCVEGLTPDDCADGRVCIKGVCRRSRHRGDACKGGEKCFKFNAPLETCPAANKCPMFCNRAHGCPGKAAPACDLTSRLCAAVVPTGHECVPNAIEVCQGPGAHKTNCSSAGRCDWCDSNEKCTRKQMPFCDLTKNQCVAYIPTGHKCIGIKPMCFGPSHTNFTKCDGGYCTFCNDKAGSFKGCQETPKNKFCDLSTHLCAVKIPTGHDCVKNQKGCELDGSGNGTCTAKGVCRSCSAKQRCPDSLKPDNVCDLYHNVCTSAQQAKEADLQAKKCDKKRKCTDSKEHCDFTTHLCTADPIPTGHQCEPKAQNVCDGGSGRPVACSDNRGHCLYCNATIADQCSRVDAKFHHCDLTTSRCRGAIPAGHKCISGQKLACAGEVGKDPQTCQGDGFCPPVPAGYSCDPKTAKACKDKDGVFDCPENGKCARPSSNANSSSGNQQQGNKKFMLLQVQEAMKHRFRHLF